MGERVCAWCGASLEERHRSAKYCSNRCKDFARYESRHGTKPGPFSENRFCERCSKAFVARTSTRKYCCADCRYRAKLESGRMTNTERARKYRAESPDRYRQYDKIRRAADPEKFRERAKRHLERLKMEDPEKYQDMLAKQRERERSRNAERALSILILSPTHPLET